MHPVQKSRSTRALPCLLSVPALLTLLVLSTCTLTGCGSGGGSGGGSSPTPSPTSTPTPSPTATPTPTPIPPSVTTVIVTPGQTTVSIGQATPFNAVVAAFGGADPSVAWGVQEGPAGGSISADGAYTAPATPGVYHIVAISRFDPTKTGVATATVQAGNVTVGADFPRSGELGVEVK